MTFRRFGITALVLVVVSGCGALVEPPTSPQPHTPAAPVEPPGLKVGEKAPGFSLQDQEDETRSLDEFLGKGKVALVFFRSVTTCTSCRSQLMQLNRDIKALEADGITVVAISHDQVEDQSAFSEMSHIAFPLLADTDSKTIDAYRMRYPDSDSGESYPATFVLDKEGVIRAKLFRPILMERHSTADLQAAAKSFP